MPSALEDVRETLTGRSSRRRWLPWQHKPTFTEQVGQTASDLTGQVVETTGQFIQHLKGMPATLAGRSNVESQSAMMNVPSDADVSAERSARAAEAAAQAAQSAAGAVERLGSWMAALMGRAPQMPLAQVPPQGLTEEALAQVPQQERGKHGRGVAENLKRTVTSVGQRISDLSDGRYGLETSPPKAETKQAKTAQKRRERRVRSEVKAEQPGGEVRWFPWVLGMSLGLVAGIVGVVYWQRRRLQRLWGQTSQRLQQATGEMRQRLESGRQPLTTAQPGGIPEVPEYTRRESVDTISDTMNQQVNGRMETPLQ